MRRYAQKIPAQRTSSLGGTGPCPARPRRSNSRIATSEKRCNSGKPLPGSERRAVL